MSDPALQCWDRAADLPSAWDGLAGTCFRERAFLTHTEAHNPCRQRYWTWSEAGELRAGAVVYTLVQDLFTYLGVPSPLRMTVVGLPCSVAWSGLLGAPAAVQTLLPAVLAAEGGFVLGLNTHPPPQVPALVQGATLPTLVLRHAFADWGSYLAALRADYRRRLRRVQAAWQGVEARVRPCAELDWAMYGLYRQAYARSDTKLELLSPAFLRLLPAPFRLTTFQRDGALLGWHICAMEPGRTTFFMGGVDQALNLHHHTYFNLLFHVLRLGIEAGTPVIDLGQTAEVAKLRTGAQLEARGMFGWHPRAPVRGLIKLTAPWLAYRGVFPPARVFREGV